jgi:hypothetical protein
MARNKKAAGRNSGVRRAAPSTDPDASGTVHVGADREPAGDMQVHRLRLVLGALSPGNLRYCWGRKVYGARAPVSPGEEDRKHAIHRQSILYVFIGRSQSETKRQLVLASFMKYAPIVPGIVYIRTDDGLYSTTIQRLDGLAEYLGLDFERVHASAVANLARINDVLFRLDGMKLYFLVPGQPEQEILSVAESYAPTVMARIRSILPFELRANHQADAIESSFAGQEAGKGFSLADFCTRIIAEVCDKYLIPLSDEAQRIKDLFGLDDPRWRPQRPFQRRPERPTRTGRTPRQTAPPAASPRQAQRNRRQ